VSEALDVARAALAGHPAWLVGGAVRDRLLGRDTEDLDLVVPGDVEAAASAVARRGDGTAFALSEAFGAWRIVGPRHAWQIDVSPRAGASIEEDLARRDFTVNAMAEPLEDARLVDPFGGAADLERRLLRMVAPEAFDDDPLRVVRLARLAVEVGLRPEEATVDAARRGAPGLERVAGERIFAELRRIVAVPEPAAGVALLDDVGGLAATMPELSALRGVEQSDFHHRDVWGHTLLVLDTAAALECDPSPLGPHAEAVARVLAEPLADELTRAGALRFGALLHDVAKPPTRRTTESGRVTFLGHDQLGADMAREILARLRTSERLRAHVAALVRHHLRLGFLVHEPQPLARRTVYGYLRACTPVAVDVTLLSVAERLATRGERATESIEAHLRLARDVLTDALPWQLEGPPAPLLRGDELGRELGMAPGPQLGELLAELAAAQYAGELSNPEQALAHARRCLGGRSQ
jgi:poly(A) polymerase